MGKTDPARDAAARREAETALDAGTAADIGASMMQLRAWLMESSGRALQITRATDGVWHVVLDELVELDELASELREIAHEQSMNLSDALADAVVAVTPRVEPEAADEDEED